MSIILRLPQEMERRLQEEAERTGLSLEVFLTRLAEQAVLKGPTTTILSSEDWEPLWRAWARDHTARSSWADDSRDAIYGARGE